MATIVRGPAPPSRGALLGQQVGRGLGLFLGQQFRQRQEDERAQQEQERARAEAAQQLNALVNVLAAGQNPLAAATAPPDAALVQSPQAGAGNPLAAATAQPPVPMPAAGEPTVIPITGGAPGATAAPSGTAPPMSGADPTRVRALLNNTDALASLLAGTKPEDMLTTVQSLLSGPEPIKLGANERLLAPGSNQVLVDVVPKEFEPQTELGRLRVELQRGVITPEEFRIRRRQILAGNTPAPRQAARDLDVVLPDGSRVPAVGEVRGNEVLVADPQGNFRPLAEVFPNAVRVEQTIRRTQEIPTPTQPFTREEFVSARDFGNIDPTDEAVGPADRAMSLLARTPGIGQTAQALFGEDFGLAERAGNRIFTQLENRIVSAFRPGADNRLSNQEMEMARRLVPSFGAFATEPATAHDLRTLRDMANSLLDQSLQVANQPDRFDSTIVRAAQQRMLELGDVLSMVDGLLLAKESGALPTPGRSRDIPSRTEQGQRPSLTPQRVQMLPPEQLQQVVDSLSEEDLQQLDDETLRLLSQRLGGAQ